jgi:hypothetical protein
MLTQRSFAGKDPSESPAQQLVRMPDGSFSVVTQPELAAYQAQNAAAAEAAGAGTGDWSAVGPDWAVAENVLYGDPRYSWQKEGLPDPNWSPGQVSPYWQQFIQSMQPRQQPGSPMGPQTGLMALLGDSQGQAAPSQLIPLDEEETRRRMFAQYGLA